MSLAEIGYRIKERFLSLVNDDRKIVKLISRLGFLGLFAVIIIVVAPTSAEETSAQPEPTPVEVIDSSTAVAVDTSTPTPYASPVLVDTSTIAEMLTVISIKETTTPLSVQPKFTIKVPATLTVDPRATTKFVPQIYFSGSEYVLACVTGSGVNLDIAGKRTTSDGTENGHIIVGDMTSALFVSGKTAEVLNLINSANGLFAYTPSGGIADRSVSIELVAMTHPGVKRSFCDSAKSSATLTFRSMGLGMDTTKSGITLK
jgi:hypothetical protein